MVKFAVFTDLHQGLMHDAEWRLQLFLKECREIKPDFVIQLGDFVDYQLSDRERNAVLQPYGELPCPVYHVLGNHDLDSCSKEEMLELLKERAPYYSFDCGGYHFVVLDCNYYQEDGLYVSYSHGNYKKSHEYHCCLSDCELEWLEKDLRNTDLPVMLFSHQCLRQEVHGLNNAQELRQVIHRAGDKVRMAINGHNHMDALDREEGILYFNLNSMSNQWLGSEYATERYGKPYDDEYRFLTMTAPYQDPLFALITAGEDFIDIKGVESRYVGKSPYELRYPFNRFWREGSSRVSSHYIRF